MTQEQKDVLLKDLCARLPYEVKVHRLGNHKHSLYKLEVIDAINYEVCITSIGPYMDNSPFMVKYAELKEVKPYLFPLSSMTEEQKSEINLLSEEECDIIEYIVNNPNPNNIGFPVITHYMVDWCNKNHFDYRGLIPMGLAIDATGLNIY